MNNKYITKRLAEFESLYEDQKEILDRPVCCTKEDCLCNKDTVWEHLKDFIAESIQQAVAEEKDRAREILIDGKRYQLMEEVL